MGRKQEKGKKGEAIEYYSRKQALRHLQVSLPNFTRLCQWKGIYPTQPNNVKLVSKGDARPKIYYKRKDVNLLLHDPILDKLRVMRAFNVKLRNAKERKDKDKVMRLLKNKPRYTLHHIVKELYPSVEDALRNVDDCLKTVFIVATLPKMTQFNGSYIALCKRLKLELMNLVIATQAVRRAFLSVKGLYVEVELKGVTCRWIMPHQHAGTSPASSADYRMIVNQAEFDCTLLMGLLNSLYRDAGLVYPPRFPAVADASSHADWTESDLLASLAFPPAAIDDDSDESKNAAAAADRPENLDTLRDMSEDLAVATDKMDRVRALQTLFRGKTVFLNREVPREPFCFLLRACGASVSWDASLASGATFAEDDDRIDLHVIDRPLAATATRMSRFYVQPQFVVDSINAARLLPVKDYLPGARLIPHLCPFVDYTKGYVPAEYRYLQGEIAADELHADIGHDHDDDDEDEEDMMDMDGDDMDEAVDERQYRSDDDDDDEDSQDDTMQLDKTPVPPTKSAKPVKRISKEELEQKIEKNKEIKLREMALPKKRVNLYNKMKHAEKTEKASVEKMQQKRQQINKNKRSASRNKK